MNRESAAEISRRLAEDLNQASAEYMRLQRLEMDIIRETSSGIPLPDGVVRIIQAWEVVRVAFAEYQRTVKRYRDFLDRGVVPEDLMGE